MIHRIAFVALVSAFVFSGSALADYKKVGKDNRTAAKMAEDECSAMSNGSGKVITGQILGGLIGQAIARGMYVRDCMRERGYEWQAAKKPAKQKAKVKQNFGKAVN